MLAILALSGCVTGDGQSQGTSVSQPAQYAIWEQQVLSALPADADRQRYVLAQQQSLLVNGQYRRADGHIVPVPLNVQSSDGYSIGERNATSGEKYQQDTDAKLKLSTIGLE
ncbi:hypothetical protein TH5_09055 [Thalassospira xianhensis MCCC 1A02616]|uniref:Uncharacterized protein n=1 Tax=Thalassospira xianhensis MCCC 1A02616 TaxID=1177929 RepID=A0A367UDV7_9PROT|nr:hypothetical protein TH5_09055 [Thalassospira xianhensis MCCC 1A02616]